MILIVPHWGHEELPRKSPFWEGKEGFSLHGWVLPVPEQPTPAPLQRRGIILMLNGATEGGMGNSSENPPYQAGRTVVSFGFRVLCAPPDVPLHPLPRENDFHAFVLSPDGGMGGS